MGLNNSATPNLNMKFWFSLLAWLLPLLSNSLNTPAVPLPPPRPLRSLPLSTHTLPLRVSMLDTLTDTLDSTDTTDSMPELTTTELTPELTLMAHTPTMLVPLLDTPTVPLPPPRPLRSLPLSKLTLPPTASPLPLPLHTPMLPSHTPDSSLTPTEPLSPLSPQMSLLPARNIWLPMLPLKRTN